MTNSEETVHDTRHVEVRVYPKLTLENGEKTAGYGVHFGLKHGNLRADYPTDFIFTAPEGWRFHAFDLAGRSWPGVSVFPQDADFEVAFGDEDQKTVVMTDHCSTFYPHYYQLVLENIETGALATTDPSADNGDRD